MEIFCRRLAELLGRDPGNRGFAPAAPAPDLPALAQSLAQSRRALIVTGFPIVSAGVGETDGPPGAAHIAAALLAGGTQVWVATDARSLDMTRAACRLRAPRARVVEIPRQNAPAACRALLEAAAPDHIIAIERPGKCGGHFHNARGQVIDALVADTDALFQNPDAVTVAVGDGGNELGMGALRPVTLAAVPNGGRIAAELGCDFPLAAGVSNWWGWGLSALLSVVRGENLLPSKAEETALLAAVLEAGAVDGVTGRPEMTVDGLSLEANLEVLRDVEALTRAALARKKEAEA